MQLAAADQVELARSLSTMKLPAKRPLTDQNDLEAVAQEFESLFMNMMLKSMRAANRTLSEGNYFDTFESRMYEDMLDEKLSVHMTKSHSLGIADLLVRQLRPEKQKATDDVRVRPATVPTRQTVFQTPDEFVAEILPRAKSISSGLGVDPRFVVAQAALETGWGKHIMFDDRGRNSHNLFGIKATADWRGRTVAIESLEVVAGVAALSRSNFKVYNNYDEAMADYAALLRNNDRYAVALNSSDIRSFGDELHKGGYATDPDYAHKLKRVLDNGALGGIRTALKVR